MPSVIHHTSSPLACEETHLVGGAGRREGSFLPESEPVPIVPFPGQWDDSEHVPGSCAQADPVLSFGFSQGSLGRPGEG